MQVRFLNFIQNKQQPEELKFPLRKRGDFVPMDYVCQFIISQTVMAFYLARYFKDPGVAFYSGMALEGPWSSEWGTLL